MILVDTNVIIDLWRKAEPGKIEIFENNEIAICTIVKAELIFGAKNEKEKAKIIDALDELIMLSVDEEHWESLYELLYKLRREGITVPFQDALIAVIAERNDCLLWTNDNHFKEISVVLKDLKLMKNS